MRESQPDRRRDHHFLVERVQLLRHARQNAGRHLRSIRIAVQLLIRRFANPRACRLGLADQRVEIAIRRVTPSDRARSASSAPSTGASCGSSPASGSRNSPSASNSRTTSRPMPLAGRKYTTSTGMRRPMRSSRPMRCSTTDGFHGRSNSTSRRQNSKLRPSPPHSVDTSRLGPSTSRKQRHLGVAARRRERLRETHRSPVVPAG